MRRRWLDFRNGHGLYLIFALTFANFIKIAHQDGDYSFYAHLKKGGVFVVKGQKVDRGQLIGLSGCTGHCDGAHLHFEVFKKNKKHKSGRRSIPIVFKTDKGLLSKLARQESYRAIEPVSSDKSGCL